MTWTDVTLRIPNISKLTDEELEDYLQHFDGRWSSQTKALVAQLGGTGLDLNRNWALVGRCWFCPCCRRYKPELVRKAGNGILIARLELHHDHMREATKRVFAERFGTPRALPRETLHSEDDVIALVKRFSEEMICTDCNAADGHVKSKLAGEIHPDFSFRPSEIGAFIESAPNRVHNVDIEKARDIWKNQQAEFAARFDLIRVIMDRLEAGALHCERGSSDVYNADLFLRGNWFLNRAFDEARLRDPKVRWGSAAFGDFMARSTSNDGAGLHALKKQRRAAEAPSDAEFEALNQKKMRSSLWRRAGGDWRCACCGRSKREICRKSNKGKWTGRICPSDDYLLEREPASIEFRRELYPAFADDPMIGDYVHHTICQDCADLSAQLKTRRPKIGDVYFSIEDLRQLIGEVEPNRNHERDFDAAAERAIRNAPLIKAAEAFREHYALSGAALTHYQLARSELKDTEARVYAAIKLERERSWPEGKLDRFIDWLLAEGARLHPPKDEPVTSDDLDLPDEF